MSLKHDEVQIPACTKRVLAATICDLCGREEPRSPSGWSTRWDDGDTYRADVTVSMRRDYRYENDSADETEYHLCPTCFRERLMPWLASQGARPTVRDLS